MLGIAEVPRAARLVWRSGWRLLLLALAMLVTAAVVAVVVLPRASHGVALTVLTGSMTPGIPVGSVVIVRPVDPATLRVGDVATYQVEEGKEVFITHRVTKVRTNGDDLRFRFQGDANRAPDRELVPAGAVRGKVWFHVPYVGGFRDALRGKGGIALLGTLLLGGYAATQIATGLRSWRKGMRGHSGEFWWPLVRVDFDSAHGLLDGEDLASRWGATFLRSDSDGFSLLIGIHPERVSAALELIRAERPSRIQVWDSPADVAGISRDIKPAPRHRKPHHASTR